MNCTLCQRNLFYLGIIVLTVTMAFISLLGCNPLQRYSGTDETSIETTKILFEDKFSQCGRWTEYSDAESASSCANGVLELSISVPHYTAWSIPGRSYGDCVIEVDATPKSGPKDSTYGLIFRYVDSANFSEFDISSNGFYSIGKFVNDEWVPFIDWTEESRIRKGLTSNHLRVEIRGRDIVLFINGSRIATCTDIAGASGTGDIGVIANTFEQGGTVIQFDNFEVTEVD